MDLFRIGSHQQSQKTRSQKLTCEIAILKLAWKGLHKALSDIYIKILFINCLIPLTDHRGIYTGLINTQE